MIALCLLAAVTAPSEAPPATIPPRHFLRGAEPRACDTAASNGEVVVCGRTDADAQYRLRPQDDQRFAEQPVRAEAKVLGEGTLKAHGEQAEVGGFSAPRAMVTFSWPF
jgi:hypothetical protein